MKVIVAIDGSPCSDAAIDEVCRRSWPPGAEVHLVIVDCPLDPNLLAGGHPTAYDELIQHQRAVAANHLSRAAAIIARRAPDLRVIPALLEGSPKEAIVAEADRWGADLIIVGSHGYGGIKRLFLGSVSLAVATYAHCSVLIARRPE